MYKFRIAATNDVGTSEFSIESDIIRTKQSIPKFTRFKTETTQFKDFKIELDIKVLSTSKLILKWIEFINLQNINDNDYLTKYKLVYKLVGINNKFPQLSNELIDSKIKYFNNNDNLNGINHFETVEIFINYKNTTKNTIFSREYSNDHYNLQNYNFIKHEYVLENNFLENGTYEIYLCGVNSIGESQECIFSKKLIYIEDRLPQINKKMSLIESILPVSSTELNITWRHATKDHINGKLYAYQILLIKNELLNIFNDMYKKASNMSKIVNVNEWGKKYNINYEDDGNVEDFDSRFVKFMIIIYYCCKQH